MIPTNFNNNNQQNNNQYQNNNNQNNNNPYRGEKKQYNNIYIYVPSFCVKFDWKYSIAIKDILPKGLCFMVSKSGVFKNEFNSLNGILTLSLNADKNVSLAPAIIEPNANFNNSVEFSQLVSCYENTMKCLAEVLIDEEKLNNYLEQKYNFSNLGILDKTRILNEMVVWKSTLDFYNEKRNYKTNKESGIAPDNVVIDLSALE